MIAWPRSLNESNCFLRHADWSDVVLGGHAGAHTSTISEALSIDPHSRNQRSYSLVGQLSLAGLSDAAAAGDATRKKRSNRQRYVAPWSGRRSGDRPTRAACPRDRRCSPRRPGVANNALGML